MSFNIGKCTVLHLGHKNMSHVYYLGEKALDSTDYEKDIGVYMHSSLKPSLQVAESVKKATRALGQLLKCVTYRDKVHYIRLYKQYVRCHLEFACQAWNPWLKQDIDLLEGVQKRAIKCCYSLEGLYEDKLKQVGLATLYERHIRGNMIQTFKIIREIDDVKYDMWFAKVAERHQRTRRAVHISPDGQLSETMNIVKPKSRLDQKELFQPQSCK